MRLGSRMRINKVRFKDITATLNGARACLLKRHVGPFRRRRQWLAKTQWLNAEQLNKLQLDLLRRIVTHSYETVPYYREMMTKLGFRPGDIQSLEDVQRFPILRKSDVKAAGEKLFSRKFSKMFVRTAYTGGTTGERLMLKRDLRSIGNEHAFVRRQFDWAGIDLVDRCAYMMARVIAPTSRKVERPYAYDAAMRELTLSVFHLSKDTIPIYAKAVMDYEIKALVAHPSAAYILAKGCLDKGIRISLKGVLTTAETLDSAKKETISKAFGCKVYDFYGSGERVCYIHTCERGSYHIIPEYGLTELLPAGAPNKDCYKIIATGFWNMAMPLIRYDTGDLVQPSSNTCQCGRAFPTVKRIVGRESSILTTHSGITLGASTLEAIMENVLFAMQKMPVLEGQVIQESRDIMTLEYVPLRGFCQKDADTLKLLVEENFPEDFKVNVRPVEKISRTVSGKALSLVIPQKSPKMNNNV
jgi:phenylacetate-CoA ligase